MPDLDKQIEELQKENKRLQRELYTRIYEEVDDLQERLGKQGQELVKWIGKAEEWKDMCKRMYYLMTDIIHLESEKPSNAKKLEDIYNEYEELNKEL